MEHPVPSYCSYVSRLGFFNSVNYSLHPQLLQPIPQRPKTDPQSFRRRRLVPPRRLQRLLNRLPFNVLQVPFQVNLPLRHGHGSRVRIPSSGRERASWHYTSAQVQIVGINQVVITQGKRPLQYVFQFPHVAGEVIASQAVGGGRSQAGRVAFVFPGDALEYVVGQQGDVVAPVPQWRHRQFDHVDTVEQVLAEAAFLYQLRQVFMGGAQDADVYGDFLGVAYRAHGFFLDGAQQFYLHGQGQVGHFVQEKSAAVGAAEQTGFIVNGAGEAAFLVAEEFAFHQFRRYGSAVDGDEWAVGSRALQVDHPGNQFFTAAGFTADKRRSLAAGQFAGLVAQFADLGGITQQQAGLVVFFGWLQFRLGQFQGAVYQFPQAGQFDGFGDKVKGAGF